MRQPGMLAFTPCRLAHGMFLWLLLISVSGCQSLPPLSPAASSGRQLVATQWLQIRSQNQQFDAISLLEIDGNTMKLAATTPQGQTLLTAELREDGTLHTTLAPWLQQSGLSVEHIARDVQLALWPAAALALAGWQIEENGEENHRVVRLHGETWAEIHYEGGQQNPVRIVIVRGQKLYTVELRTLEWTHP